MLTAGVGVVIAACALLAPAGADDEARRAAKVTLAAYETTQQAILIYGRLPSCDAQARAVRLCKDPETWRKLKIVERAATAAIAEATPVLNGAQADAGQLVAALIAVENVKRTVIEAHDGLKEIVQ